MEAEKRKKAPEHPEGKIKLRNGSIIDGYPISKPEEVADDTLSSDTTGQDSLTGKKPVSKEQAKQEEDLQEKTFLKNAFFLYSQRERIYADSRMFLAPVPIVNTLDYTGTKGFRWPTLGMYLEWWESCDASVLMTEKGGIRLISRAYGSLSSGANDCMTVDPQGNTEYVYLKFFLPVWSSLTDIYKRYDECKAKYQAYSIGQVVQMLDESTGHEHRLDGALSELKARCLEIALQEMKKNNQRLQERYDKLRYKWTVHNIVDKLEQVKEAVNGFHALKAQTDAEWKELNKKKKETHDRKGDFMWLELEKIKEKKVSLMRGLEIYKVEQAKKIFPHAGIYYDDMEKYMQKHACEQDARPYSEESAPSGAD